MKPVVPSRHNFARVTCALWLPDPINHFHIWATCFFTSDMGRLNIEILYQGRDSHSKDLYIGNIHTWKDSLYNETGRWWCIYMVIAGLAITHYSVVIMSAMTSQITDVSIVSSTVGSGADQRKHQSSVPLAFVRRIHRWPVDSPHKGPVMMKRFPFDNVIMHSRCRLFVN